jgi:hypothetical protein
MTRDDHVKMLKNGRSKLVPMLEIESWIHDGLLEASGYTFGPGAEEIYEKWHKEEIRRRQLAKKRPPVIIRDPGFVDISRAVGEAEDMGPLVSEHDGTPSDIPNVEDLPKDKDAADIVPAPETIEILED